MKYKYFLSLNMIAFLTAIQMAQAKMNVLIPEPANLKFNPIELKKVNEKEFNKEVMPELKNLQFYSYKMQNTYLFLMIILKIIVFHGV